MLRLILSIIGGLVAAFALVFLSDALFHALTPSAAATPQDASDREAMRAYVAAQPAGVLAALIVGWTVAAFAGSWIAARFGGRGAWPGWLVGGLFLVATASNFVMIPHPAWMVLCAVVLIIAAVWLGARLGARGPSATA